MAKTPKGRPVHGIVLLDKRQGISSNRALQEIKRLFNANKAGHTGSLDPLATGLLPICLGEATKVSGLMLEHDKSYYVDVQLGTVTDTGDLEGQVLASQPVPAFSMVDIHTCVAKFVGIQAQVPPMYSALKCDGKKLYELARAGISIERQPRQITIYGIDVLSYHAPVLSLTVSCSKGTYIRTLAEDIGQTLGCGATVQNLRRLQVGSFNLLDAYTVEQLAAMTDAERLATLLPIDAPLQTMPKAELSADEAQKINYGQSLRWPNAQPAKVRLYQGSTFLGLGEILLDGKLAPLRLFNLNSL
jgi:tRNA pseudouridine55 synthase